MTEHLSKGRREINRAATRLALIECAEALFAENGIEGVRLREIGASVDSANNGVVAYYFGSKEALIEAIYCHRLPALDQRRAELLEEAEANGTGQDIGTLIRILCLPLLEQTDAQGRHSYAGFLASISRSSLPDLWDTFAAQTHVTRNVMDRLQSLLPAGARERFRTRLRISIGMITNVLNLVDRCVEPNREEYLGFVFEDALRMVETAICTSVAE